VLPRERLIRLNLTLMDFADDAVEALGAIMDAVSQGNISPSEAAALATLVKIYGEAIDMADVVKRLDALEAKTKEVGDESDSASASRSPGKIGPSLP
jgi:hypothetical protein